MKLKKIGISYMDHPQVLKFYHEILNYLCALNTIPFENILDEMKESVNMLEISFNVYHRNTLVRQISLEQRNLQHNLLSLKYRLKKNLATRDALVVPLTQKAIIVLDYYYTAKHITVENKDDKIFTLVDALEDFLTEKDRLLIGISTYVRNLKKVNNKLRTLILERDSISVTTTKHNLLEDRHAADNAYRDLVNYMNLQIKRYPDDEDLIEIIESLNTIILTQEEVVSTILRQRKAISSPATIKVGVA